MAHPARPSRTPYFENLDALRFFCFLAVFFFHGFFTDSADVKASSTFHFVKFSLFSNGNIGVNFFFVLSGFLITHLLIREKITHGEINVPAFWMRRVLRIWPLYFFCVLFGFVLFPLFKTAFGEIPHETASVLSYLTFTSNFDVLRHGMPDSSVLGVLWSVGVEEQFYLLWPLLLVLFPLRRYWIPLVAVMSGSLVFRVVYDQPAMHEMHTLSCIGDMAVGGMGAWLINCSAGFRERIERLHRGWIAGVYVAFFALFFFREELLLPVYPVRIAGRLLLAGIILLIIIEQNYAERSLFKLSRLKRIMQMGTITYGLYCLHFIGILVANTVMRKLGLGGNLWYVLLANTAGALLITIVIAQLSFRFFERPFLRLKERMTASPERVIQMEKVPEAIGNKQQSFLREG